jgi:YegS/Rv2252/BmrU family lipid kinase
MPFSKRAVIIANPTAGMAAGRAQPTRILEAARHDLERHGLATGLLQESNPTKVGELAERAVRDGFNIVIAAGGDGTVNAVANGIMRATQASTRDTKNVALGVLPLGTGNVSAFNLGIPKPWREACRIIRDGHVRAIDVGLARTLPSTTRARAKSRYFLLMAGIGFDAKVIEETSLRLKYVLRDFAYVLRTLQNVVLHQGTQMTLEFDNGSKYANVSWLVMIGNAASYAWDIKVTSHAELDDGLLDVCLMPFENKLISIQQAMQILTGQHIERGIAQYWKVRSVRVESLPPVPVQLDGDEFAQTPIEISVLPSALNVLAPPAAPLPELM